MGKHLSCSFWGISFVSSISQTVILFGRLATVNRIQNFLEGKLKLPTSTRSFARQLKSKDMRERHVWAREWEWGWWTAAQTREERRRRRGDKWGWPTPDGGGRPSSTLCLWSILLTHIHTPNHSHIPVMGDSVSRFVLRLCSPSMCSLYQKLT